MPQQTKTEALEELARLIRRDIMNGTARLNETWWFDNDTKMQDRIAHVLLDYSDEEKPKEVPVEWLSGGAIEMLDRINTERAAGDRARQLSKHRAERIDQLNAIVDNQSRRIDGMISELRVRDANNRDLSEKLDALNEKCAALVVERDHIKAQFAEAFGEQRERAFDKMAKPLVEEQGPWVVVREVRGGFHYYTDPTVDDWGTSPSEAKQFSSKLTADVIAAETTKDYASTWFVRTLAEAGGQ